MSNSHSPLRLLLFLEWTLLGTVAIAQILIAIFNGFTFLIVWNCLGLGILWLMGWRSPQKLKSKFLHLGIGFVLILLMTILGHVPVFPLLLIVLVIRNCIYLEGRSRSIVTGMAFMAACWGQTDRLFNQGLLFKISPDQIGIFWVNFSLMFSLLFLFLQLFVDAMLSERKSREELMVANNRLRDYALKIEELATLQERNHIAREIHDSLGHSLTGFNLYLEAALKLLYSEPQEAEQLLIEAKQLGSSALKDVRQSVAVLRSDPLQGRSLATAVNFLVHEFQRSTGVSVLSNLHPIEPIPNDVKIAIYRIAQEALTNIAKYASASAVEISLKMAVPTRIPQLELMIKDNGKGFSLDQNSTGFGLQGMRERTLALRGHLEITTALGQGCQIMVEIPLNSIEAP